MQPCASDTVLLIKVKRPFHGYNTWKPHYLVILIIIYLWLSTQICYTSTSVQISPYPVRSKFCVEWNNSQICCNFKVHLILVEYFNFWKRTFLLEDSIYYMNKPYRFLKVGQLNSLFQCQPCMQTKGKQDNEKNFATWYAILSTKTTPFKCIRLKEVFTMFLKFVLKKK